MEENLNHNVDKLFRESLQSSRQDISSDMWNRIESRLDEDDNRIGAGNRRKQLRLAALLFLFILFAGGIGIFKYSRTHHTGMDSTYSSSAKSILSVTEQNKDSGQKEIQQNNAVSKALVDITPAKTLFRKVPDEDLAPAGFVINAPPQLFLKPAEISPILTAQKNLPAGNPITENRIVKPEKQKFGARFSITPYYSKELAGYTLSDDDVTSADGKEIEKRERNVFSASVGLYLNYRLNKKWSLQSGISYSWSNSIIDSATSYAVKDNTGTIQFKLNTISGYGYIQPSTGMQPNLGDSVSTAKTYSELHYLSVPIILYYHIPLKRFSLLAGGGVTINMLSGASIETKTYGSGFQEKEYAISMLGLKKVNYGIIVKADLQYHVNSRIGADLIISFKNTLSPINLKSALSAYPYNLGIGLGATYHF